MLGLDTPPQPEGVARINGKPLEQSQLKKYDKNEKQLVIVLAQTHKGNSRLVRLPLLQASYRATSERVVNNRPLFCL